MVSDWADRRRSEVWWARSVFVHAVATWFMVGLIWTVHVVHYPSFAEVGPDEYVEFQAGHVDRIGALLAIPWALEGLATVGLIVQARSRRELVTVAIAAVAGGAILLISGFASAPAHGDLSDGFDAVVHDRLMAWNLVRTLLWTAKGVAAALLLWWAIPAVRSAAGATEHART